MFKVSSLKDKASWDQLLTTFNHDVFHTFDYNLAYSKLTGSDPILFIMEFNNKLVLVWPLLERKIENSEYFDLTSAYGYSGPVCLGNFISDDLLECFYIELNKFSNNRYVSLFSRSHPILNFGNLGSKMYVIDVLDQQNPILKNYRGSHRREISKALNDCIVELHDFNKENFDLFFSIYNQSMNRLKASDSYYFSPDYIKSLFFSKQFSAKFVFVLFNKEVIGASILLFSAKFAHYFLSGSNMNYNKFVPGKLMIYKINQYCSEKGINYITLGGGVGGGDDTLSSFKKGFTKSVYSFFLIKKVLNIDVYNRLTQGISGDFFPLYRGV